MEIKKGAMSEWKPVSDLTIVQEDISNFGYNMDYIKVHKLDKIKRPHWSSSSMINYYEPLEVMVENGSIYYRENENYEREELPEAFETQFGTFNNHNRGEFYSWLGKDDYEGLTEKEREQHRSFGRSDYYIKGNFCDMFDCGDYSYAISNLMHMCLGEFKIVRIDKSLNAVTMYDNSYEDGLNSFEYLGRFDNGIGWTVIFSGSIWPDNRHPNKEERYRTILLQIDHRGNCDIGCELDVAISSANSLATVRNLVYFGHNKMITRLDLVSGEIVYLTNKNDEELAALEKWKW